MQPADAVGLLTSIQSERAHTELLVRVWINTAQADEIVPADTQLGWEFTHIAAEQILVEIVMACRDRSVHCVQRSSTHDLHGLVE